MNGGLPGKRGSVAIVWTPDMVGECLIQAFVTLDRLPSSRGPRKPGGHWPRHSVEWADQLAHAELEESERLIRQSDDNRTVIVPTTADITQMEMMFDLLREVRVIDPDMAIVAGSWALCKARGRSVRALCAQKKLAPRTFYKKLTKSLMAMAKMLNANVCLCVRPPILQKI